MYSICTSEMHGLLRHSGFGGQYSTGQDRNLDTKPEAGTTNTAVMCFVVAVPRTTARQPTHRLVAGDLLTLLKR